MLLGTIENMLTHFKGAMKIPPVDLSLDIYKRTSPCLNFIFETDKGCSTFNLCAMPMLVVWNDKCIQKLLQFFTMQDTHGNAQLHAADKRNKFSADIMKKFLKQVKETSKVSNTGKKSMDIAIEVYTPALVFPEQYDCDMGCLRVDFSKLLIKLSKDRLNTTGTILLNNANIEMPSSLCQELETIKELGNNDARNSHHQQSHLPHDITDIDLEDKEGGALKIEPYIVKPFDIRFQFEKGGIINRDGDNVVNISINPFIDLQIRAINIVRLNYITDKVLKSLQKPKIKVKKTKKHKNNHIQEEEIVVDPADIDFIKPKLLLNFTLPELMVCLVVSEEHIIELCLSELNVKYTKRWGDATLFMQLDSIALTDSKRPESHPAILWTTKSVEGNIVPRVRGSFIALNDLDKQQQQQQHNNHPMRRTSVKDGPSKSIEFKYLQLTSPYSPLYDGDSKNISFKLKDCNIAIDDGSISRLVPFTAK